MPHRTYTGKSVVTLATNTITSRRNSLVIILGAALHGIPCQRRWFSWDLKRAAAVDRGSSKIAGRYSWKWFHPGSILGGLSSAVGWHPGSCWCGRLAALCGGTRR